jgi:Rrf2 family protein
MSFVFSRSCQYALQAVIYMARVNNGRPVHLRKISDTLNIPHHFLGKILQILVRDHIVQSTKGLNGGFQLAKPASDIRLADIVRAVDGDSVMDECILGFPECEENAPCPLHEEWSESKEIIVKLLGETTVDRLTTKLASKLDIAGPTTKTA